MKCLSEIKRDWFHNKRCYEAFVYAAVIVRELIDLQKAGAVFFDEDGTVDGSWVIELNDTNSCIGLGYEREGNVRCCVGYIGMVWDCKSNKIWVSKKEVNKAFKDVKYIMPKHLHSVSQIIKDLK